MICLSIWGISCAQSPSEWELLIQQNSVFDVWIEGGGILDGSGRSTYEADVLIRADEIVYIGPVEPSKIQVQQHIEAKGKYVTPGFIDTHAHGDPLRKGAFQNFLSMGVTTVVLGQDGYSPPVQDMDVWMQEVDQQPLGTNVLMFMGHGTLRELTNVGSETDLSSGQQQALEVLLRKALEAGCWGLSTGLEYTPGRYATTDELMGLARIVGEYDGILMSHIRNEDDDQLEASLNELLSLGSQCRVHVSHIKSVYGKGTQRAQQIRAVLDSARQAGVLATADLYPYMASYTTIGIVFPGWARPPHDFSKVLRNRKAELRTYLQQRITKRNGPEATLFGTAPYTGLTLADIARQKRKSFDAVLMEDMGPQGASAAYFIMDENLQEHLVQDSLTMICSDGSPTMHHPRGYGSFAKVIESFVIEKKLLSLKEAIWKMTGLPAQTLGLSDRGILAKGMKADLLVFDPEEIHATATYDAPFQLATGFDFVLVNGKLAKEGTVFHKESVGRVLRK